MTIEETSRQRNQLTGAKHFKLCSYLTDRRADIVHDDAHTVARRASEALGFPVTANNVVGAAKDADLGLFKPRAKASKADLERRVEDLETAFASLPTLPPWASAMDLLDRLMQRVSKLEAELEGRLS